MIKASDASAVSCVLYFSGTPSENGCIDDLTGVAFQSIEFASSGFSISGTSDLKLTGGVSVDAGVSEATIAMNVAADSSITIDVTDADAQLTLDSLSGSGDLSKTGEGMLALSADTHSGTTVVSAGTLSVGPLPSVFPASLQSGVTFNTLLPSAAVVGNPGDSGGTFTWTAPTIAGGALDLDPNTGILQWSLGSDCQAGNHSVTITYTYSGGHQVSTFPLNIEAANTPPVFDLLYTEYSQLWYFGTVYIVPDGTNYLVSHSFAARGGEGTLTYSLSGTPPPGTTFDTTSGDFSCNLALSPPLTLYDFDVTVTDSAGQFDRIHVIADPYPTSGYGGLNYARDYPKDGSSNPWLVATDSTDNFLPLPLTWPDILWGYPQGDCTISQVPTRTFSR